MKCMVGLIRVVTAGAGDGNGRGRGWELSPCPSPPWTPVGPGSGIMRGRHPHPSSLRSKNPGLKTAKTQHKSSVPLFGHGAVCPDPAGVPEGLEVRQKGVT